MNAFHAHVYFDISQTALAEQVRANLIKAIPQLGYVGSLIAMPIGPHPKPMFELHIAAAQLADSIQIIDDFRQGLSVLIHPVQQDEMAAHTVDAKWLGEKLPLNLEILKQLIHR